MSRPKVDDVDKLIGRLPDDVRRRMLDTIAASSRDHLVAVEHAYDRKLEGASTLIGTIVAVAFVPSGSCSTALVVEPADPKRRTVAISAAHVLRIRAAHPWGKAARDGFRYRLGEVLAGPPLTRS